MFANHTFGRRPSNGVSGGSSNDSGKINCIKEPLERTKRSPSILAASFYLVVLGFWTVLIINSHIISPQTHPILDEITGVESSVTVSNIAEFEDNPDISTQSPTRRRAASSEIDDEFSVDAASGVSSPWINSSIQSISSSQTTPPTKNNKGLNVFLGLRPPSLSKQFSSKTRSEPALLLSPRNVRPPLMPKMQDDGAGEATTPIARTRGSFNPQAKIVSPKDVTTYNLAEDICPTKLLNNLRRKLRTTDFEDSSSVSACRDDDIPMESIRSKDSTDAHLSSSMRQFIFVRRLLRCLEYASWTILAIVIQFVFGMDWAFPDGPSCPLEEDYLTLVPNKNASMCFLMVSVHRAKSYIFCSHFSYQSSNYVRIVMCADLSIQRCFDLAILGCIHSGGLCHIFNTKFKREARTIHVSVEKHSTSSIDYWVVATG